MTAGHASSLKGDAFKMAGSSSDEEKMARLKETAVGVSPASEDSPKSITDNRKNDFPAKKLAKLLDDM